VLVELGQVAQTEAKVIGHVRQVVVGWPGLAGLLLDLSRR
jgi:hypothetical protein